MGCFVHAVTRESFLPLRTHYPIRASGVPATQYGRRALPSAMLGLALWLNVCELAGVQRCERANGSSIMVSGVHCPQVGMSGRQPRGSRCGGSSPCLDGNASHEVLATSGARTAPSESLGLASAQSAGCSGLCVDKFLLFS